jgi:hypothetical protein
MQWCSELAYALRVAQRQCDEHVVRNALRAKFPAMPAEEIDGCADVACKAVTAARLLSKAETLDEAVQAFRSAPELDNLPQPGADIFAQVYSVFENEKNRLYYSRVFGDSLPGSSEDEKVVHAFLSFLEALATALERGVGG